MQITHSANNDEWLIDAVKRLQIIFYLKEREDVSPLRVFVPLNDGSASVRNDNIVDAISLSQDFL